MSNQVKLVLIRIGITSSKLNQRKEKHNKFDIANVDY